MSKPIPAWIMRAAYRYESDQEDRSFEGQAESVAKYFAAEFDHTGLLKAVEPFLPVRNLGTHWEGCHETHRRCALVLAYSKTTEVENE